VSGPRSEGAKEGGAGRGVEGESHGSWRTMKPMAKKERSDNSPMNCTSCVTNESVGTLLGYMQQSDKVKKEKSKIGLKHAFSKKKCARSSS
jgi:hypothetical protein